MTEAYLPKRTDQDVPASLSWFNTSFQITSVNWQAAHENEEDDQGKCKVRILLWKHILVLDLKDLPDQAREPKAAEYHCKSIELVVD